MKDINHRKLAIFLPTFGGGGAERAMLLFAEGVVQRGYEVDIVVCTEWGPLRELVGPKINVVTLGVTRVRHAIRPLAKYLREVRPAALYATIQHANVVAIAARIVSGVSTKVIVRQSTSHLSERARTRMHALLGGLIPWLYPMADGVIAVSEGVKEELKHINSSLDVRVLPNPVLTPAFDFLSREPVHHPWFEADEPPVVLGVGRLTKTKGFSTLIEAFAEARRRTECRLVILGEGPERSALEQLTSTLGLEEFVHLPGFVVNPLPFMKRARLFVLASEYEGMPNSLLQAIACGTAVVSTDCPSGPREILGGGVRGRLIPVGDVSKMADAIVDVLQEGANPIASEYVRNNFSLSQTVSTYLEVAGLSNTGELLKGTAG